MSTKEKTSTRKGTEAPRKSAAERLSDVAGELFYRKGIRAVGVDEIVSETGVTKPTLYRSFESKDELITTCVRHTVQESRAALDAIAVRHAGDPLAHLRAIIQYNADKIAAPDFRGCAVTIAAVEFPEPEHPAHEVAEECKAELRGRLDALTRQLPVGDPDTLADGLMLLMEGACAARHTSGSQGPSAALMRSGDALIRAFMTT